MTKGGGHSPYKSVRREGGARVLALTPFIPAKWKLVKVEEIAHSRRKGEEWVSINIKRVV